MISFLLKILYAIRVFSLIFILCILLQHYAVRLSHSRFDEDEMSDMLAYIALLQRRILELEQARQKEQEAQGQNHFVEPTVTGLRERAPAMQQETFRGANDTRSALDEPLRAFIPWGMFNRLSRDLDAPVQERQVERNDELFGNSPSLSSTTRYLYIVPRQHRTDAEVYDHDTAPAVGGSHLDQADNQDFYDSSNFSEWTRLEHEHKVHLRGGAGEDPPTPLPARVPNTPAKAPVAEPVTLGVEECEPPSFPPAWWKCTAHGVCGCKTVACQEEGSRRRGARWGFRGSGAE